jgi:hypothetical protein
MEKPEGCGTIRLADGKSVSVRYSLVLFQTVDDEADTGQLAGQLEVRGALEVAKDQSIVNLSGQHFTLRRKDSRCLEAWAKKGDPVTNQWEIVATAASKWLEPC